MALPDRPADCKCARTCDCGGASSDVVVRTQEKLLDSVPSPASGAYTAYWAAANRLAPPNARQYAHLRSRAVGRLGVGPVTLISGPFGPELALPPGVPVPGLDGGAEFEVIIGAARFAVPRHWYITGAWRGTSSSTVEQFVWPAFLSPKLGR